MYAEVIGSPIAHSRSPAIHNGWIRALGLQARYNATQLEPDALHDWLQWRRSDGLWRGCSITAPLKISAMSCVDKLSSEGRRIEAINLIYREGRNLVGHNTDLDGLKLALRGLLKSRRRAVIIGAGGAARAALAYAADEGFKDICVIARRPERVFVSLLSRFSASFRVLSFERADAAICGAGLIINATPLGSSYEPPMHPRILSALGRADLESTVLDMVYETIETELIQQARALDLKAISGLAMLEGQARSAFELLFGQAPPDGIAPAKRGRP
jgi:shikimate dehydrogenase